MERRDILYGIISLDILRLRGHSGERENNRTKHSII